MLLISVIGVPGDGESTLMTAISSLLMDEAMFIPIKKFWEDEEL